MERQLQERLIGATVLMVVAVLVVPELLSGPKPAVSPPGAAATPVESLPTLLASTEPSRGAVTVTDPKPPAVRPLTAPTRPPPTVVPAQPAQSRVIPPDTAPPPARPQVVSPPVQAAASRTQPRPAVAAVPPKAPPNLPVEPSADEKRPSGKGAWLVQVGSYSKPAAAERVAKDLQNHGFAAVILPVELQGKRLYRVRVGPAADRKTADQTLRKVQRLMPGSRLVGNR